MNHKERRNKINQMNKPVQKESVWKRMVTAKSKWDDKDEFLDVIYWTRQILGIILGIIWGLIPLRGFIGIALFAISNAGILYLYIVNYQQVDEDDYGGTFEMAKEGFMTSFAGFLVTWIIIYSGLFFD
uniref:Uncharacterized protein C20orf24 homolog n=1 Tax=Cacopsylla melanoneura TaxID=428564 RepID=A0A8D8S603_9HEMI